MCVRSVSLSVLSVVLLYVAGAQCRFNDAVKPVNQSKSSSRSSLKSVPSGATDDLCSADLLSNSSLRRKLFFHGDEGTPLSPVRCGISVVAALTVLTPVIIVITVCTVFLYVFVPIKLFSYVFICTYVTATFN